MPSLSILISLMESMMHPNTLADSRPDPYFHDSLHIFEQVRSLGMPSIMLIDHLCLDSDTDLIIGKICMLFRTSFDGPVQTQATALGVQLQDLNQLAASIDFSQDGVRQVFFLSVRDGTAWTISD